MAEGGWFSNPFGNEQHEADHAMDAKMLPHKHSWAIAKSGRTVSLEVWCECELPPMTFTFATEQQAAAVAKAMSQPTTVRWSPGSGSAHVVIRFAQAGRGERLRPSFNPGNQSPGRG